jgi:hypothetical protein
MSYNEEYGLNMKLEFNATNGYYIIMPISKLSDGKELPNEFINAIRKKKTIQCTSMELVHILDC